MNETMPLGREYMERYPEWREALPGNELPWLAERRADAFRRFAERGFPTRKVEAWKYTNLNPLTKKLFAPGAALAATPGALPADALDEKSVHRLLFINGRAAPGATLALPDGVRLMPLSEALETVPDLLAPLLAADAGPEEAGLLEMNTALMTEGAVLLLEPGVQLEKPVHFFFLTTEDAGEAAMHLRNLLVAGKGSEATVFEHYLGTGQTGHWTNVVTEIVLADDAHLHHYKLQNESKAAYHIAATTAKIGERAVYDNFAMSLGAALARNDIQARLDGRGIDCRLNGLHLARGHQHMDTTTVLDHQKPECRSSETYKSVVDDQAETVFQGKVLVRPDSQKTSAHQLNRSLLLSDEASANAKPELRIYADDVQCSHGATISELDEQALFYFRSRGIAADVARRLLTEAFLAEMVEEVKDPTVHAVLHQATTDWLGQTWPKGRRP